MDKTAPLSSPDSYRQPKRGNRTDYKRLFEREPALLPGAFAPDERRPASPPTITERMRGLAGRAEVDSVAFQGVVAVALQSLARVRHCEQQAAEAALSLAQRMKLQNMVEGLDATIQTLRDMLGRPGATMLDQTTPAPTDDAPESSWWFALCEAMHALENGLFGIQSIAAGQPAGTVTHALSGLVVLLLRHHYNLVFAEAEQWMA